MSSPHARKPSSKKYSPCIVAATEYMEANFSRITSVTEVAAEIGLNYNTLRSRFRRETGLTLVKFLNRTRLEKARELLRDPVMQVKDIAWRVGYNNESRFTQAFRNEFGLQPSIFRSIILSKRLAVGVDGRMFESDDQFL